MSMFDLSSNNDEGKPASGLRKAFRLAEIGNGYGAVVLEEYASGTASTGRNYLATAGDGRHFFGCDPDMMFEMDGEAYRTIQPICSGMGTPVLNDGVKTLGEIGNDAVRHRTERRVGNINLARRGCEFYVSTDGVCFRQVKAMEYYAVLGVVKAEEGAEKV